MAWNLKKLSHKNTIKALSAVALPVWVVKSLEILRIFEQKLLILLEIWKNWQKPLKFFGFLPQIFVFFFAYFAWKLKKLSHKNIKIAWLAIIQCLLLVEIRAFRLESKYCKGIFWQLCITRPYWGPWMETSSVLEYDNPQYNTLVRWAKSNAWSMSPLSHRPRERTYCIVDLRIFSGSYCTSKLHPKNPTKLPYNARISNGLT